MASDPVVCAGVRMEFVEARPGGEAPPVSAVPGGLTMHQECLLASSAWVNGQGSRPTPTALLDASGVGSDVAAGGPEGRCDRRGCKREAGVVVGVTVYGGVWIGTP